MNLLCRVELVNSSYLALRAYWVLSNTAYADVRGVKGVLLIIPYKQILLKQNLLSSYFVGSFIYEGCVFKII